MRNFVESKKKRERFFVEEAAKLMGKTWGFGLDREHPDFLVTEDAQQFGLEVSEIFTGRQDRAGSARDFACMSRRLFVQIGSA